MKGLMKEFSGGSAMWRVIIREINVKNDDDMKKCRERGSYAARGKNRKGNGIDGP